MGSPSSAGHTSHITRPPRSTRRTRRPPRRTLRFIRLVFYVSDRRGALLFFCYGVLTALFGRPIHVPMAFPFRWSTVSTPLLARAREPSWCADCCMSRRVVRCHPQRGIGRRQHHFRYRFSLFSLFYSLASTSLRRSAVLHHYHLLLSTTLHEDRYAIPTSTKTILFSILAIWRFLVTFSLRPVHIPILASCSFFLSPWHVIPRGLPLSILFTRFLEHDLNGQRICDWCF